MGRGVPGCPPGVSAASVATRRSAGATRDVRTSVAGGTAACGRGGDSLKGGAGDDVVSGGGGDDSLAGNSGDDVLDGGAGTDVADGGSGTDQCMAGITIRCERDSPA
ncbi:MAG: hypothetical protein GXP36_01430 [Actinobacteria bacterium]|nr:hypothetical protein [Actinomycetota bacterium]